jgi:hypothetical protein
VADLFDPDRSEGDIVAELAKMRFIKVGQGSSAYVYGDTDGRVVLKVFPPLGLGTLSESAFLTKNPIFRVANRLSLCWEQMPMISRLRDAAKSRVVEFLSRRSSPQREVAAATSLLGYEACIEKGLMTHLPTRILPNCVRDVSLDGQGRLIEYLAKPARIVLQKRFRDSETGTKVLLQRCKEKETLERCFELVETAVRYEMTMWQMGLTNTDMSFNVFDNSIVLPDGSLQLHDASSIRVWQTEWYLRYKEQDLQDVFSRIDKGEYPAVLYDGDIASIRETARRLHRLLPTDCRDDVIKYFLESSRKLLRYEVYQANWGQASRGSACPTSCFERDK